MSEGKYPVEWRGKAYAMSDLTVGVKKKFCTFLRQRLKAEVCEDYADDPVTRDEQLAGVGSLCWWGDAGCSATVGKWIRSPEGGLYLNRLLFGDDAKGLTDADLLALMAEKEPDPASDYMVAMHTIREVANPK